MPVATNPDGEVITHLITTDFVFSAPAFTTPIAEANTILYQPVVASMDQATLYRSAGPHHGPREAIPRDQWLFARCDDGKTIIPTQTDICLPAGFSTDAFYELVYEGSDPIVLGLGFAAMRDVVSFLKYDRSASNPLHRSGSGHAVHRAIAHGSSQSASKGVENHWARGDQFPFAYGTITDQRGQPPLAVADARERDHV